MHRNITRLHLDYEALTRWGPLCSGATSFIDLTVGKLSRDGFFENCS